MLGWLREGKGWSGVAQMGAEATSNMLAEILQASLDVNNADWKDKGWKGPTLSNHREARYGTAPVVPRRAFIKYSSTACTNLVDIKNKNKNNARMLCVMTEDDRPERRSAAGVAASLMFDKQLVMLFAELVCIAIGELLACGTDNHHMSSTSRERSSPPPPPYV